MNEWWSTSLVDGDKDEDFDIGAMCIGNLDNASPPRYKHTHAIYIFAHCSMYVAIKSSSDRSKELLGYSIHQDLGIA